MIKKYLIILLLVITSLYASAQSDDNRYGTGIIIADTAAVDSVLLWPRNVQATIDSLLTAPMFETSQVGLMVYDLTADSAIYRHNERQTLRPASTMKVITAIAAVDRLGGSYQFKTSLCYTGTIDNGTLTGDVYCVGGFDPLFNSDDMNAFVESICLMGVDTIRGRIVADKSMKDEDRLGEGWCWDDMNPVLSPLLVSRKDTFTERFVEKLCEAGVVVDAYCSEEQAPEDAFVICTRFHTIDQVLMRMMKDSDNLFAEAMLYQIAAATGDTPASAKQARTVIRRLIKRIGLDDSAYRIADGSGLSLYNYVSAELEVAMLRYAYRNTDIYLHLYPSLPIAGEDGTLKKRMLGTMAESNVRAKTGTLAGISSLAGYCTAANGHALCFAIINQGVMRGRYGKAFQDRVCEALCRP